MKTALIAAILTGALIVSAFAADSDTNPQGLGQDFEQKKSDVLKHIEQRIARVQEEKACVQSAKAHSDIRACREKFRVEMKQDHQNRKP
jgi:hypothetical protein